MLSRTTVLIYFWPMACPMKVNPVKSLTRSSIWLLIIYRKRRRKFVPPRWCNGACSPWVRKVVGSILSRVKPLSTQHLGVRAKTGHPIVRTIYLDKVARLPEDCGFFVSYQAAGNIENPAIFLYKYMSDPPQPKKENAICVVFFFYFKFLLCTPFPPKMSNGCSYRMSIKIIIPVY